MLTSGIEIHDEAHRGTQRRTTRHQVCLVAARSQGEEKMAEEQERQSNVGYLTCYYWAVNGRCKYPDDVCKYAHYDTGTLAEQPIRLRPGERAVAGTHLRMLAPFAPLNAVVANRNHPAFVEFGQTVPLLGGGAAGTVNPGRQRVLGYPGLAVQQEQERQQQQGRVGPQGVIQPPPGMFSRDHRSENSNSSNGHGGTGRGHVDYQQHSQAPAAGGGSSIARDNDAARAIEAPTRSVRIMSENELVAAVMGDLLKKEEKGEWRESKEKALEAAQLCAKIWKEKYGDYGNL